MRQNFKKRVVFDKKSVLAIIIPEHRNDGIYYEVNISGYHRFYMHRSPLDRYDIVPQAGISLPEDLVLAVSDAIEEEMGL